MGLPNLHCHLDGSLRPSTVRALARELRLEVPALGFHVGMGLSAALAQFAFTVSLLRTPAAVRRVADEICEDAQADGVTTLEIRFAPQLHGRVEAFVEAALEGIEGRAGLVLCGLYGEPPDRVAELARQPGIVGLDLAGGPAPGHAFGLADYATAFRVARERGIGRTVHAAEGRSAEEIRIAVEVLGAQRIGHGTTLLDDPSVVDLVRERGVTIEACPTSNAHVGAIADIRDHPLPKWLAAGVKACVNPDNTLLSAVSASEEHRRARAIPGMTDALLAQAIAHGHAAAFSPRTPSAR